MKAVSAPRKTVGKPRRLTDLAKIHIAAKQLGLRTPGDDSAYRDMLWSIGRVRSAKDLDEGGRTAVLKHLRNCGFKDGSTTWPRYSRGTPAAMIRWLWTQLADAGLVRDRSDRALRRYIAQHARMAKPGVQELAAQHLERADAADVIEQLKRWLERSEVPRE